MPDITNRESRPADRAALDRLYAAAFPEEELRPLVRALLQDTPGVLSLVAADADTGRLVGHVALTPCRLAPGDGRVALLGPLAVTPDRQRRGVGRALVAAGLARLRADGAVRVFVLGDPDYYRHFGFAPERAVAPPYPLPAAWRDAWQALALAQSPAPLQGTLSVPAAWADPAYWAP
jgi:putative acetyltransferase